MLHEPRSRLPGGEQEQGIGNAQGEDQQRHAVVALAARTVMARPNAMAAPMKNTSSLATAAEGGSTGYEIGGMGRHHSTLSTPSAFRFERIDAGQFALR